MDDFKLAVESAIGDVKAYETYINLQSFLYYEESESALESTVGDWLKKAKDTIVEFFKKILEAIKRFFAKLFGNKNAIMNSHALQLILETIPKWESEINKISLEVYGAVIRIVKDPSKEDAEAELPITSNYSRIQDFKSECNVFEAKIKNTLMGYHEKSDYIVIDQAKFNILYSFANHSQDMVMKILEPLSKLTNSTSYNQGNTHRVISRVNEIADAFGYASNIITSCINKSVWDHRNAHEDPKLETNVPWGNIEFE